MSSAVYYKFKSQKNRSRITFDGTGISVFDLKREILISHKLESSASTFDLKLTNPDTGEVYDDDSEVIPRSTYVEISRIPPLRSGDRNTAAKYVTGNLVVSAKNASRREDFKRGAPATTSSSGAPVTAPPVIPSSGNEEDMMAAIFQAQGEQWKRTQQEMAEKAPVYHHRQTDQSAPDKQLRPSYICHRCGQKGHWINNCPSIDDPNWEIKRVRRTTGIPRSMLRTVEKPTEDDNGTYLMTADGEYVVAVADDKSWQDFQRKQQRIQAKVKRQVPEELQDPITHELLKEPVKTPCCGKTYSDASIQSALINSDFECPNCHTHDVYIDQLQPDEETERKVYKFDHPDEDEEKDDTKEEDGDSQDRKRPRSEEDSELSDEDTPDHKRTKSSPNSPEQNDQKAQNNPQMPMPFFPFMMPPFMPMMPGQGFPPQQQSQQQNGGAASQPDTGS